MMKLTTSAPRRSALQRGLAVAAFATVSLFLAAACSGPPPRLRHFIYDAVVPSRQKDHEDSQMGRAALNLAKENGDYEKVGIFPTEEYPLRREKAIDPEANLYVILQVDGGGILGITPAMLVEKLEAALGHRRLGEILSVCSGSSTGAIITGSVAAGVPAGEIAKLYHSTGYDLYQGPGRLSRLKPFQFRLNREPFQQAIIDLLATRSNSRDPLITLKEMERGPLLIITAYDLVSGRTLFLRTRHPSGKTIEDGENLRLVDAISASAYSGAYVFGKIPCPSFESDQVQADGQLVRLKGAVFTDGGQGTQNSTLTVCALEALSIIRSDPKAQVILISMGSGNVFVDENSYSAFDKKMHARGLRVSPQKQQQAKFEQVAAYRPFQEILATGISINNQARDESIPLQLEAVRRLENDLCDASGFRRLLLYRFDFEPLDPCGFPVNHLVSAFHITPDGRDYLLNQAEAISQWESFRQLERLLAESKTRWKVYRP